MMLALIRVIKLSIFYLQWLSRHKVGTSSNKMSEIGEIGFIGGGEMAYAVAMGMVAGGLVKPSQMHVSNPSAGKLERFQTVGIHTTHNNMEIMRNCNIIVLCVKPQIYPDVLKEIRNHGFSGSTQLILSVMAGITSCTMEQDFPWARIVRTMPNTPCLVKAGVFLYCRGETATDADMELTNKLLSSCAECILLPERLIDAAQAITGCGVAYMFTAMDALADGGVKMGVPRAVALKLAAHTFIGAGKMHLETGKHPGVLKDAVTSPGGVTICALHALDKGGFRAALIDAVEVATKKSLELGQKKK